MAERVSSLLRRSVGHLEDEVPDSYRLLVSRVGPMVVELNVDGEVFSLSGGQRLQVSDGAAQTPSVRIVTSRAGILDLLDARVGLDEAVEAGTVWVGGSLDDVQRAHDSLLAYVHAAVRAPTQPGLLSELREGA
ncbi:SCP-2 sterol transfer family protein [Mycobacterium paraense]|uniref:SCP-2 sterol transfer family protein n=1 Tax=Mycobacterium paraense TaxID=767916 RepID=A0A1X2A8I5_9MYCO|nr:SCP-2 sterol transfer family protein [Mycobacterium paraense]MCV7444953.1 SCP-2 sterol transfer family protein [Mycobacterium paraense]ORW39173.1 SCP-2 sterol transfer family protein [Mycobacterium paraense]ORW44215.1 SCP-2 sterol transfer family protein [Mycobacterium paraense]